MTNALAAKTPARAARVLASTRLPPLLLGLALAWTLLLNADRAHYYAPLDWETVKNMAIAENLSPRNYSGMFIYQSFDDNGEPSYEAYNRFPVGGFALIKLAALPFGENMLAKVFAARMLMLAFLALSAFLAYRSIARIASNGWIALTAVLFAFSSYYILRYGNWVSVEFMMDLFAVMLTFHGMVIFAQEGRFRQLLIKTCVALLIGWKVYVLLAPFVVLGLASEIIQQLRAPAPSGQTAKRAAAAALRSRYSLLGAVALLFGAALLAFNFVGERQALNAETPFAELPSVQSMLRKLGGEQELIPGGGSAWTPFLSQQFQRIASASLPYALTRRPAVEGASTDGRALLYAAVGVLLTGLCAALLLRCRRNRMLLTSLALSGFIWALLARNYVSYPPHEYMAIFYVGVPLTLVTLLLLRASRSRAAPLLPVAAAVALAAFALSAGQLMALSVDERTADRREAAFSDLASVRKATQGKNVLIAHPRRKNFDLYGEHSALYLLLAGSRIRYLEDGLPARYDFALIPHARDAVSPLATPENEFVFLYEKGAHPSDVQRAWLNSVVSSGTPAARGAYDVYIGEEALVYVKEERCDPDLEPRFFLHIFPERADDLPARRKEHGFDNMDFHLAWWDASVDGMCAARVPLPDYPIAGIRTGQFTPGEGELWEATFGNA